jgi:hypothetical protein
MLKKSIFMVIIIIVAGSAVVSAQQYLDPGPRFDLPEMNRLFQLKDQQKTLESQHNQGMITEDEYNKRYDELLMAINEIEEPIRNEISQLVMIGIEVATKGLDSTQADRQRAEAANARLQTVMKPLEEVNKAIERLWPANEPGWHAQEIRECIGFTLQPPPGTRTTSSEQPGLIRMCITPYTDQIFNTMKQQLERGLGAALEDVTEEGGTYHYQYILRSNRSPTGKPYWIELVAAYPDMPNQPPKGVDISIAELRRDP